jgi:Protein of unknown function (DUF3300)
MCKSILASVLSLSLLLGAFSYGTLEVYAYALKAQQRDVGAGQPQALIPNDQLDSLVAPIALYPDPLLSQVLVASTYPLEIIQLQQWIQRNGGLKGDDLTNAVQKQDWDPSIQAMAVFPDLVKRLADDVKWTTDLGNAFLAQQDDVMNAVQRMRKKAMDAGNLKSSEQQKVETKTVETKTVVVIQPASTQVVYVPVYSPVVVYGPPVYPYPPIYYPPPSYYPAGVFIAFGAGVAYGSYYRGGWGYGCGWGYSRTTININVNNNYISHYNKTNINVNRNINNVNTTWQHNPQHRGGTPYSNKAIATQYGGTARGDSMSTRQANARQQQGSSTRQQPTSSNRAATTAARPTPNPSGRPSNTGTAGTNRSGVGTGANSSNTSTNRSSGGNNIGNRQIPSSDASRNKSAFDGISSKANAQASSARGTSSMGASRGAGTTRSGGGARRPS